MAAAAKTQAAYTPASPVGGEVGFSGVTVVSAAGSVVCVSIVSVTGTVVSSGTVVSTGGTESSGIYSLHAKKLILVN